MECLKCGRETRDKDVFCPQCLTVMENAPVKPDTPVILPQIRSSEKKSPAKKQPKPDETIARLRSTIKRLWAAVALLAVLFCACVGTLTFLLYRSYNSAPVIGSNYNTISPESGVGR